MRITEAAQRLGISPRMLRYRESLGLLPVVRSRPRARRAALSAGREMRGPASGGATAGGAAQGAVGATAAHRQFGSADLEAVALGLAIERRYDISPAALAFGLRVLGDAATRAEVTELGRRIGRLRPLPAMAMDFEKERALRLLGTAVTGRPTPSASGPSASGPSGSGPSGSAPPAPS